MRLSLLQKYILRTVYESRLKRFPRDKFIRFYQRGDPLQLPLGKGETEVNTITKSIERLIDKELMVGYGVRTPHKWYIHEVKLTAKGKKVAKRLQGQQQILPFRNTRNYAEPHAEKR